MNQGLMLLKKQTTWKLLNDQYNREFATAVLFYDYAGQAERLGMTYFPILLENWAQTELEHAKLFFTYLASRESWPKIDFLYLKPQVKEFTNPKEIAYELKKYQEVVSDVMVTISKKAVEIGDMATVYFIEHFVKDQILEEKKCIEIISAFEQSNDLTTADRQLKKIDQKYHNTN